MRLLLDTQAFVWWVEQNGRLSDTAQRAIADEATAVFISVATAWEIAIKVGKGKWPEAAPLLQHFEDVVMTEGFELLPITVSDVRSAGLMQVSHKDPFDRLIAAQAVRGGFHLATSDLQLRTLGALVVW